MLRNYFKTAFRSLRKQGLFAVMNILGLATGIACFLLMALFVRDELTFDRFHKNTDRIYRGINVFDAGFVAGVPDYMVENIKARMPEIEKAARINFGSRAVMEYEGKLVFEDEYYRADPELFEVFDFSLLYGNVEQALVEDRSLVVSRYIMDKYFDGKNPVGQMLKMKNEKEPFLITGVLNDIPDNSRFRFNFIAKMAWSDYTQPRTKWFPNGLLYVLTAPGTELEDLAAGLERAAEELGFPATDQSDFLLESYGNLYLKSDYSFTASGVSGNAKFLWIFGSVAIVLLLIACINYINSATARSLNRNKEIGVRRTIGASGGQIRYQLLAETLCTTFAAMLLSAGLVELLLPLMNKLAHKQLSVNYFTDSYVLPFMLLMLFLVTFLAGIYPAFFSSRIGALDLFRRNRAIGKGYLRYSLVVFQFVITLTLIFSTQIILNQVKALQDHEIGMNVENILSPQMPHGADYELMKNTLGSVAGVEEVTSAPFPYPSSSLLNLWYENDGQKDSLSMYYFRVEPNAPEVYDLKILKGTAFDPGNELHRTQAMISQGLADKLPFENPIGQQITVLDDEYAPAVRTIIGVYQDPNFNAKSGTYATVMLSTKNHYGLDLKLAAEDQESTILRLGEAFASVMPDRPFEYTFLKDVIMARYNTERDFGSIFKYAAAIAIIIAAIGLVGLSAFTVVQKYKEIGVRKVLGATVLRIMSGLLKRYLSLVLIATLLATPVAYLLMDQWLSDFTNRISIPASIFMLGFGMAIILLFLTVGYQTMKAAMLNPVEVLKDE